MILILVNLVDGIVWMIRIGIFGCKYGFKE